MIRTLFMHTFMRLWQRPLRLLITSAFIFGFVVFGVSSQEFTGFEGHYFVWILGAGIIGGDLSTGVLQQVFSRPVRRWQYVLVQWAALCLACLLVCATVHAISAVLFLYHQIPATMGAFTASMFTHFVDVSGMAALMILLSCLLPGNGDVGAIATYWIVMVTLPSLGLPQGAALMHAVYNFLNPANFDPPALAHPMPYEALLAWFSSLALCLVAACLVLNRREISYAD